MPPLDTAVPDLPVPDLPVPDQPVPDLPVPDLPVPDLPVPDQNTLKPAGKGCAKGSECQSGVCNPVKLVFSGKRKQSTPFNVPLSKVKTLGTQGVVGSNGTGPIPVWPGTGAIGAYLKMDSPNIGASPWSMSSKSHGGLSSLSSLAQSGLRFDFSGLSLVTKPLSDLRTKGKILFSDPQLQATTNLIYFHSERTSNNSKGHRSEKRTYHTGSFKILSAAGATLAQGAITYVNFIIDYDNLKHFGWGRMTVSAGSALYTELMAAFGKAELVLGVGSLDLPVYWDNPNGTPLSGMFAVYNMDMAVKALGEGICK